MPVVTNPVTPYIPLSTLKEITQRFPRPEITDRELASKVRRRSTRPLRAGKARQYGAQEIEFQLLEALGDGLLEASICRALYGKISQEPAKSALKFASYRSVLRDNRTLAQLAFVYDLHRSLDPPLTAEDSINPPFSASLTKILADVFEAYVGAVGLSREAAIMADWLEPLFASLATCMFDAVEGPAAISAGRRTASTVETAAPNKRARLA